MTILDGAAQRVGPGALHVLYHRSCPSDEPFWRESENRASMFGFHRAIRAGVARARRWDSSSDRSKHTISESPPFCAVPCERGLRRPIGRKRSLATLMAKKQLHRRLKTPEEKARAATIIIRPKTPTTPAGNPGIGPL